jgi:uncharacterized protein (UPF0276 family)
MGVGVGLRQPHYQQFLKNKKLVSWLEVLSDNYIYTHGVLRNKLLAIRENYPMVMHGVGLNIGSVDPLNLEYLNAIKSLAAQLEPAWLSDHLCWTGVNHTYSHDLLPLPYTEEALHHVVARVAQVQDHTQCPLLLENVSSYLQVKDADYSEAEFLNEVAKRSGCFILLDINNIFVSAHNHDYDAETYLQTIDPQKVKQFHLAGFEQEGELLVDTHGARVAPAVWQLYARALQYFPDTPTNIEWDNNIPSWENLLGEVSCAQQIMDEQQ